MVFNWYIVIDTKENHLKFVEGLKSIIIQILLYITYNNITPISDAMDRARL